MSQPVGDVTLHGVLLAGAGGAASQVTTIGVNAYLWRAALETLAFMPMAQTDTNGGVIVTDWYVNPNTPTERMKVTVTVLDQDLRADALRRADPPGQAYLRTLRVGRPFADFEHEIRAFEPGAHVAARDWPGDGSRVRLWPRCTSSTSSSPRIRRRPCARRSR